MIQFFAPARGLTARAAPSRPAPLSAAPARTALRPARWIASAIAAGLLMVGAGAQAAVYQFGKLYSGAGPSDAHIADLQIDDLGSGHWSFFLHNIDLSGFGSGAYVGSIAVDGLTPSSVTTTSGGGVDEVTTSPSILVGGFDFRYVFGGVSNRLVTGESLSWDAFGLGSTHLPLDGELALSVNGTTFDPSVGWYLSTEPQTVPEPPTFALLMVSLGMLGLCARHRSGAKRLPAST